MKTHVSYCRLRKSRRGLRGDFASGARPRSTGRGPDTGPGAANGVRKRLLADFREDRLGNAQAGNSAVGQLGEARSRLQPSFLRSTRHRIHKLRRFLTRHASGLPIIQTRSSLSSWMRRISTGARAEPRSVYFCVACCSARRTCTTARQGRPRTSRRNPSGHRAVARQCPRARIPRRTANASIVPINVTHCAATPDPPRAMLPAGRCPFFGSAAAVRPLVTSIRRRSMSPRVMGVYPFITEKRL